MIRTRHRALAALALTALAGGSFLAPAEAVEARATYVQRTITDDRVVESSGLARSTYDRSTLWTHNDSGDSNRIFAVDGNGKTQAVVTVRGASARDWEDIASGPDNMLWVADIGDNGRSRSTVTVYRFKEPKTLANTTVDAQRFDFKYPGGARDAEGIMVHPETGRLFIVSKQRDKSGVYRAPETLSRSSVNMLTRVADAPEMATAASFGPNGNRYVVGTYTAAYIYKGFGSTPSRISLPKVRQGESLEFGRDHTVLYRGSEGSNSPVYVIRIG